MRHVLPPRPREIVGRVLDRMEVTDSAYHAQEYTRPLVEDILRHVARYAPRRARVLLIGGNSLLAQTLREASYDLELWRLGNQPLAGDIAERVTLDLTPTRIATADLPTGDGRFDVVVLPRIIEHVPASPAAIFALFRPYLRNGGILVVASRNLAALGLRVRALRGHSYLPPWPRPNGIAFSLSWPDLPEYHYYLMEELLACAHNAALPALMHSFSVGRLPYDCTASFGMRDYLARMLAHWIKRVVPPVRDYSLLVLGAEPGNGESTAKSMRTEVPHARR